MVYYECEIILKSVACENSMLMMMSSMLKNDRCYESDPRTLAKARAMADSVDLCEDDDDDTLTLELMNTRCREAS